MDDSTLNNEQSALPVELNTRMKIGIGIAIATVMFISTSSVLLIFFGMLPSFVAYIIDRSYHRSNTICVSAANLCGVFPFLLELWLGQHTIVGSILILTNLFNIAIMYFAAAFGWMLFIVIPPAVVSVQRVFDQHNVVHLKAQQKKLLAEWSKAVAEDVKDSSVLKETMAKPADEAQASEASVAFTPGTGTPAAAQPATPQAPPPTAPPAAPPQTAP